MQGNCFAFLLLTQRFRSQIFKSSFAHHALKPMIHGPRSLFIDLCCERQKLVVRQLADLKHDFCNSHAVFIALSTRFRKNGLCRLSATP